MTQSRRPRSIKELSEYSVVPFSTRFSITAYCRSVDSLYKQATVYSSEGNLEDAFIQAAKAAQVAIANLPRHPDWRTLSADKREDITRRSNDILDLLSVLKPKLSDAFEAWCAAHPGFQEQEAAEKQRKTKEEASRQRARAAMDAARREQPALFDPPRGKVRDADLVGALPPGLASTSTDISRLLGSTSPQVSGLPPSSSTSALPYVKKNVAQPLPFWPKEATRPTSQDLQAMATGLAEDLASWKPMYSAPPAPTLAYVSPNRDLYNLMVPSPAMSKTRLGTDQPSQGFTPTPDSRIFYPILDRKPQIAMPKTIAEPDAPRVGGLRRVQLPDTLIDSFVALAYSNTERKIETCGLLLGTLARNTFQITCLLLPRQKGTPDTCETIDEELIFEFQDKRDLLTIGWIHTHPSQSCFLSSLDLHTHCSYQLSLPEAIAIVCAPTQKPAVGIFRLTDPPGVETIASCTLRGFHPHPPLPLYTDADSALQGHVNMTKGLFETVDMR